jgi:uncharacterized protein (TIGR03067 family)
MRIVNTVLILGAFGFLAADDPKKTDADLLKGKWSAVSLTSNGVKAPDELLKGYKLNLEDKTYTNLMGEEIAEEGEYRIDAAKSPKTIDFDIKKGHDSGKKQLGIYKFDGDKLTIVAAKPGSDERPNSFTVDPKSDILELVLEKAKP